MIAACTADETFGTADRFFTACLTTPVKTAIRWYDLSVLVAYFIELFWWDWGWRAENSWLEVEISL